QHISNLTIADVLLSEKLINIYTNYFTYVLYECFNLLSSFMDQALDDHDGDENHTIYQNNCDYINFLEFDIILNSTLSKFNIRELINAIVEHFDDDYGDIIFAKLVRIHDIESLYEFDRVLNH